MENDHIEFNDLPESVKMAFNATIANNLAEKAKKKRDNALDKKLK